MEKTLYKKSKLGKIQTWKIETLENSFRTIEGFIDGLQTPTKWTVCKSKNVGSSNETTPEEQAIKEAEAKIKKQLEKGWAENINDVDKSKVKISPMLAHKFLEYINYVSTWLIVFVQFKLDGIRCIATKDGLFTRTGKPIYAAPHIWESVKHIFIEFPDIKLDGELYNHDLKEDFNTITSIVRKQKLTTEDLEKSEKYLQYHIYDVDLNDSTRFIDRNRFLKRLFQTEFKSKYLYYVETINIGFNNINELKLQLEKFLSLGYEGMMIRNGESKYSNSRTKDLLKWKEFIDDEFELIDLEEGRGDRSGMATTAICIDSKGEIFSAGIKGNFEYCIDLLKNKNEYIGKMVTIRYQNLTPDRQVPRFGKMLAVRDYE